jgi:hypothetical protein
MPYRGASGAGGKRAAAVIINVLKQELPKEQRSRFWAFGTGAFAYTAILLTL